MQDTISLMALEQWKRIGTLAAPLCDPRLPLGWIVEIQEPPGKAESGHFLSQRPRILASKKCLLPCAHVSLSPEDVTVKACERSVLTEGGK
jgi:hypothetical protein